MDKKINNLTNHKIHDLTKKIRSSSNTYCVRTFLALGKPDGLPVTRSGGDSKSDFFGGELQSRSKSIVVRWTSLAVGVQAMK